ncbi:DUF6090 family protein [Aegicerativicinus sediminis]
MKGNSFKYVKYAIGEIVLVVIGILIALQINNWNEYRKERKLELNLLEGVLKSVVLDTSRLSIEVNDFNELLEYADYIKIKFDDGSAYEKKLDTAFAQIAISHLYTPDYTAFDRITSVGVDIIKNDSLRNLMVHYYDTSRHLYSVETYFENSKYYRQHIFPKYFKSYKYGREVIPVDYESLKNSSEFRVALDYSINDAKYFKNWALHRRDDAKKLIALLNENLNQLPHD